MNEIIAKAQREWPHRNTEKRMQAEERARKAQRETEYSNNGGPETNGSHRKRIEALKIAIRNLNTLEPTSVDDGWY